MSRSTPADEWADVGKLVSGVWTASQTTRKTDSSRRRGRLRVGDMEREAALQSLHHAFGEGQLSQEELDARTDTALRATTQAELDSVPVVVFGALTATARHSDDSWVGVLILLVVPVMGAAAWWAVRGGRGHGA